MTSDVPKGRQDEVLARPLVFKSCLKGQTSLEYPREKLYPSEPRRLGGGSGKVNPLPRSLLGCLWGFGGIVAGPKPLQT